AGREACSSGWVAAPRDADRAWERRKRPPDAARHRDAGHAARHRADRDAGPDADRAWERRKRPPDAARHRDAGHAARHRADRDAGPDADRAWEPACSCPCRRRWTRTGCYRGADRPDADRAWERGHRHAAHHAANALPAGRAWARWDAEPRHGAAPSGRAWERWDAKPRPERRAWAPDP